MSQRSSPDGAATDLLIIRPRLPLPEGAAKLGTPDHLHPTSMLADNVLAEELALEVRTCEAAALPSTGLDVVWLELAMSGGHPRMMPPRAGAR